MPRDKGSCILLKVQADIVVTCTWRRFSGHLFHGAKLAA